MMSRCYDPGQDEYKNYGALGIKVDADWHHFRNFAKDMGIRPGSEWTIERKDNDKGYCKDNCVWATRSDQCVNRRLFKSNTTGQTGVVRIAEDQWEARFDYLGIRYRIGRYQTREKAIVARKHFVILFQRDPVQAIATLVPKDEVVWNTAKTGVRGVTPHLSGGFIARCTIRGRRQYVGYFDTIKEAKDARDRYIKDHTQQVGS
jgi:hypothetical protein